MALYTKAKHKKQHENSSDKQVDKSRFRDDKSYESAKEAKYSSGKTLSKRTSLVSVRNQKMVKDGEGSSRDKNCKRKQDERLLNDFPLISSPPPLNAGSTGFLPP